MLPVYRAGFFDSLGAHCKGGLCLFAGGVRAEESIATVDHLQVARVKTTQNIHSAKVNSPLYALWQRGILDWLEDWNPDALVVEANPRYLSTRRAIRWMHERGRPVIGWGLGAPPVEVRNTFLGGYLARWQISQRKKFLHQLDALIAYSRRGAEEYQREGISQEKIFVAPNAVAGKPRGPRPKRSTEFGELPKVLFVGRLQARKRIDLLLIACSHIAESIKPALWIVGDGPAKESLQDLASEIYPHAEFLGEMYGPDLQRCFSEADLFILPGTGGLAVQEAMTHGLPVIVAEGDGTQADLVRAGNGWLIPANDETSLRSVLVEALSDPVRLRRMGEESYKIVQKEINIERMVEVFLHVINSVKHSGGAHQ